MEKLLEKIGIKMEVAEVRRIRKDREKGREVLWVRKRRTKVGGDGKEKEAEGYERENWGEPDMRKKER